MGQTRSSHEGETVDLERNHSRQPSPTIHNATEVLSTSNSSTDDTSHQSGAHRPWVMKCRNTLPTPALRLLDKMTAWINGPNPPKPWRINPFLEPVQMAPIRVFRMLVPSKKLRFCIAVVLWILWLIGFIAIISRTSSNDMFANGSTPVELSCISSIWPSAPYCGLNGDYCRPFSNYTFAFSCPAECQRTEVLNPYTVGVEELIYQSVIIGGQEDSTLNNAPVYRGDSWICGAAIHAGAISAGRAGCGALSVVGERSDFQAVTRNGLSSIGFNSSFPLSFTFIQDASTQSLKCEDPQWKLLPLSVVFTAVLSIMTTSPAAFFAPIFAIVFFQVGMASDAPAFTTYYAAAQTAIGRFLPAALIGLLFYHLCVRFTLHHLKAPIEKTILWLGACWVGALSNYTFDKIPIQRLNVHDLRQQPGAIAALVVIIIVLLLIVIGQIWAFRREGRLPRYLRFYCILIVLLLLLLAIPGLNLRIHHYILALLLLPGTKIQTRPTLLYQGLLIGLFINGIARWGFDSILQTQASLQGDAILGSFRPNISTPVIGANNITFSWGAYAGGWSGVSVLVNDVERYHAFESDNQTTFTWIREAEGLPEYFRFAYMAYTTLNGLSYGDYTKAGTWNPDGSWTQMAEGAS